MKNILKYMKAILACLFVSLAIVACSDDDDLGSADLGLGIKVFAPTHVVAGQPMTINGSGFGDVTEVEFPGGVKVTSITHVTDEMIRIVAPAGISPEGGKIVLHNSKGETAESRLALTLGKTVVSGFSKQEGEKVMGFEEITIFGKDLLFVNEIILHKDKDSLFSVPQQDFARITSEKLVLKVPNTIFTGTFVGVIKTFDGQSFNMPAYDYEQVEEKPEGGHWEINKVTIWENDGSHGPISWSSDYRFANVEHLTGEEIAAIPMDQWNLMKSAEFKVDLEGADPQIRVTTGWWSTTWTGADIQPGNELLVDNGNNNWTLTINLGGDPILDVLDEQHFLLTGDRYTPTRIYVEEKVWVEGEEGHMERVSLWKNDGSLDNISWSSEYRFSNVEHITGEQCYAFPMEDWDIIKNGEFKVEIEGTDPQIRVTTGWWSTTWTGADIQPGNELLVDNGNGTWTLTVNLKGDPILDVLDDQHLLFTGDRYIVKEIYTEKWVDGAAPTVLWEGKAVADDWGNQPFIMSDAGIELAEAGAKAGQILHFFITPTEENWNLQIVEGHWGDTYVDVNQDSWDLAAHNGSVDLELTEAILQKALTQQWWGGAFLLNGDNVICTKVTLE